MNVAVQTLANGGLVAIPTETVYGLGAAINNEVAIAKIFLVKGRPQNLRKEKIEKMHSCMQIYNVLYDDNVFSHLKRKGCSF